ncbi:PREDICTED: paralemmin-1 isoform X3 [Chinchilla lanigera]|uniref:paralemmin-1 isoform X3 n=1 Tax=Chinchilla lanigera TaxID=34839 RepID=UPI0006978F12|nr:PREDICTED: paralemmin-1 isoform X3 [Chinchilla lanigera]
MSRALGRAAWLGPLIPARGTDTCEPAPTQGSRQPCRPGRWATLGLLRNLSGPFKKNSHPALRGLPRPGPHELIACSRILSRARWRGTLGGPRRPRPRAAQIWLQAPVLTADTASQQERLQAIAERRKRQAEIENKRRQLEDDRRQLQHLKSKALRERWLLEGTPSSASEGDEDMRRQMQEDEQRARLLEESICRLEKEIGVLESGEVKENAAAPSPARAPAPSATREEPKAEVVLNSQPTAAGTPKAEQRVSNTPVRMADGSTMMKAVVHAVDGTMENGIHPLSSSEVDELIHKADEVTLSEAGSTAGAAAESRGAAAGEETVRTTPLRREITGVQAQPGEATSGPAVPPGQEPPVTMIFMGYQNVEDEAETKKVLGLQDTITAELVVIEDAAEPKEAAPPNGSASEAPAAPSPREEDQAGPEAATSDPQDLDLKKQRCKCCSIM